MIWTSPAPLRSVAHPPTEDEMDLANPTIVLDGPSMQGVPLDLDPAAWGPLRASSVDEPGPVLLDRLRADGYLYVPGFFDVTAVTAARAPMCRKLSEAGFLDPDTAPEELVARPGLGSAWLDGLTDDNPDLDRMLYGEATMQRFSRLLGRPARHFDFTWSRAVGRGMGTAPHCDVVFMGRGTPDVVTMWTAMVDITLQVGGLAILEGSHMEHPSLAAYRRFDVDTFCENLGEEPVASLGAGGSLPCEDANELRRRLGGRWLLNEYRAGDVLLFGLGTVHASIDNASNRLRLSTDTRYQAAADPIDERWVGAAPVAHGIDAQRGIIC